MASPMTQTIVNQTDIRYWGSLDQAVISALLRSLPTPFTT